MSSLQNSALDSNTTGVTMDGEVSKTKTVPQVQQCLNKYFVQPACDQPSENNSEIESIHAGQSDVTSSLSCQTAALHTESVQL